MRIVIAEPSPVLLAGLTHVLRAEGHQTFPARPTPGVLPTLVREHHPDLLLFAGSDDGVTAALAARRAAPRTAVLCYVTDPDPRHAGLLFAEGGAGVGYVVQDQVTHTEELLGVLRKLAGGGTVVGPRLVGVLAREPLSDASAGGLSALSARERGVLALMAQGRTNSAIAEELHVSHGTVEKHVTAVFGKLGLDDTAGENRRVLAVLRYLAHTARAGAPSAPPAPEERRSLLTSVA